MAAISANGQRVRLGLAYHKAQKQRTERRAQNAAKCETRQKAPIAKNVRIDETTDVRGDNLYRYVFAYNKNNERSSETIYKKHFSGVKWSEEEFCNKGIYTYEYDTQGRIVSKTVKYENENDHDFVSYNISVDYSNPEYTAYTKYSIDYYGDYWKKAAWSFYKNGQMRHYDNIPSDRDIPYKNDCYSITYDENGSCIKLEMNGQSGKELHGLLNDSTITRSEGYDGMLTEQSVESYVYNPENGKLTEYKEWGKSRDSRKYEYVYDQFGRISAIRKYYDQNDEEDTGSPYRIRKAASNYEHELKEEPKWRLEYNETFTYFNDEVYGIGNPWHDVFGFDGPLTNRHLVDDDYEEGQPWVEDLTLNRDTNGKLLSVVSTKPEDNGEIVEKNTIDVDADGHIIREYAYSKEGTYFEETTTVDYLWENGTVVSSKEISKETETGYEYQYVRDCTYAYGDGTFSFKCKQTNSSDNESESSGTITKRNKGYIVVENEGTKELARFIQEVQTEDVRFTRPNLVRDYEGFTTDSTIIASVKDRVVVFGKMIGGDTNYKWGNVEWGVGDVDAYFNTNEDTYFSISHDGDQTICSNYKGQPRFVLKDGKLLKEIIYEDAGYNVVVPNNAVARVAIPTGEAYKEITYLYDDNGLVVGQTVTTVDENGATTDEVTVEVKYDPASGIDNMTVSTDGKLSLNGRTIGLADGQVFSVFTLDGTQLSAGTQEFTFPKAGVYMISLNGKTMKLNIK